MKALLQEVANTFEELLGAGADPQAKDKEVQVLISLDDAKVVSEIVRLERVTGLSYFWGSRKSAQPQNATAGSPACDAQSQCFAAVRRHHAPLSQPKVCLQGKDALMHACEGGQVPIIRHLVRYNAAVYAKDNQVLSTQCSCVRAICIHTLQDWFCFGFCHLLDAYALSLGLSNVFSCCNLAFKGCSPQPPVGCAAPLEQPT